LIDTVEVATVHLLKSQPVARHVAYEDPEHVGANPASEQLAVSIAQAAIGVPKFMLAHL